MPGIKPEKRLHPRRCLQVPVLFQKRERSHWGMSEDIGGGGLFLTTYCAPFPGEDLKIHLADPRAGEPMVLRGKVVHRREGAKAGFLPGGDAKACRGGDCLRRRVPDPGREAGRAPVGTRPFADLKTKRQPRVLKPKGRRGQPGHPIRYSKTRPRSGGSCRLSARRSIRCG